MSAVETYPEPVVDSQGRVSVVTLIKVPHGASTALRESIATVNATILGQRCDCGATQRRAFLHADQCPGWMPRLADLYDEWRDSAA